MDILTRIVDRTRTLVAERKTQVSRTALEEEIETAAYSPVSLAGQLAQARPHVIAEFKRRSPSRPEINLHADPVKTARAYERGGASAMSVLTEPEFFGGSGGDLKRVRSATSLPLLRKDFIVDPYQVFEARAWGADLVLLIARILDPNQLRELTYLAHTLDMEVLCEIHGPEELATIGDAPIDLLGVNCRDLKRFDTHIERLLDRTGDLPSHLPWIAESGIHSRTDLWRLFQAGYRGFLIGEYLMRGNAPVTRLEALLR